MNPAVALNDIQGEQTAAYGGRIQTQENKQEMLMQENVAIHQSTRTLMQQERQVAQVEEVAARGYLPSCF